MLAVGATDHQCLLASCEGRRVMPGTTPERDELPRLTVRQFLKYLSQETMCDDPKISAHTMRLVMQDWRDHAKRLHAELNQ
jgi:hypothetical protein